MTTEQLGELKKMSSGQIARKYTPMMMKRRITREQFDWLVSQGIEACQEEIVDIKESFTTHEDEATGRSQKEKLAELLKDGEWHDTVEILNRVYGGDHLGLARAGARIYDLKQDGLEIESEKKSGSVWQYRIVPS